MQDGMQHDPIQDQGHEPLKVGNPAIIKSISLPPFAMGAGNWREILKLGHSVKIWSGRIFDIWPIFVSRDFEVGKNVTWWRGVVVASLV